jgi:FkbM family methyltransferase
MLLLRPESKDTEDALLMRVPSDCIFFPVEAHKAAHEFLQYGFPERKLIQWAMDNFVREDKIHLDIGAHVGTYTLAMAKKGGKVHSFECNPKIYNFLCANIAAHGVYGNVTTHNIALSNNNDRATYFMRAMDGGSNGITPLKSDNQSTPTCQVSTSTLDSFAFTNVGFIKLDVEGHEKQVIEGARNTLIRNNYPPILFESWASWREKEGLTEASALRTAIFTCLQEVGYKVIPVNGWDEMFLAVRA